jgi:hypothetical protein
VCMVSIVEGWSDTYENRTLQPSVHAIGTLDSSIMFDTMAPTCAIASGQRGSIFARSPPRLSTCRGFASCAARRCSSRSRESEKNGSRRGLASMLHLRASATRLRRHFTCGCLIMRDLQVPKKADLGPNVPNRHWLRIGHSSVAPAPRRRASHRGGPDRGGRTRSRHPRPKAGGPARQAHPSARDRAAPMSPRACRVQ